MNLRSCIVLAIICSNAIEGSILARSPYAGNEQKLTHNNGEDHLKPTTTIRDILAAVGATKFKKHLEQLGLFKYLNKPGLFTVFAPTDEAFDELLKSAGCASFFLKRHMFHEPAGPENERNDKANSTFHHTVEDNILLGKFTTHQLQEADGIYLSNVKGNSVSISQYENIPTVNGGRIVRGDLEVTNGIVHLVDASYCIQPDSIASILQKRSSTSHNRFHNILRGLNQLPFVEFGPPLTILVPSKQELDDLFSQFNNIINVTNDILIDFLRRHLISGYVYPIHFAYQSTVRSYDGTIMNIEKVSDTMIKLGGSEINLKSILVARNGLVYAQNLDEEISLKRSRTFGSSQQALGRGLISGDIFLLADVKENSKGKKVNSNFGPDSQERFSNDFETTQFSGGGGFKSPKGGFKSFEGGFGGKFKTFRGKRKELSTPLHFRRRKSKGFSTDEHHRIENDHSGQTNYYSYNYYSPNYYSINPCHHSGIRCLFNSMNDESSRNGYFERRF